MNQVGPDHPDTPINAPTHTPTQASQYTNPYTNSAKTFQPTPGQVEQNGRKAQGFLINPYIRRYISLYPYYIPYLPI